MEIQEQLGIIVSRVPPCALVGSLGPLGRHGTELMQCQLSNNCCAICNATLIMSLLGKSSGGDGSNAGRQKIGICEDQIYIYTRIYIYIYIHTGEALLHVFMCG